MITTHIRRATAATAALAIGVGLALVAPLSTIATPTAVSAIPDDALILHYAFETGDVSGSTVTDLSTSGFDATITNVASSSLVDGRLSGTTALDLPGGTSSSTTAPYLTVPNGLFQNASAMTISAWVKWDGGADFQWLYNLGKDANAATFLTPSFQGAATSRSSIKPVNGTAEVGVSDTSKLPIGSWANVTTTIDESTISYYVNGVKVGSQTATLDLDAALYSAGNANSGFIGKPFWPGHPFFDGAIDDFRVYDIALSDAQVAELAIDPDAVIESVPQPEFDVITAIGVAPELPATVPALYSDGITRGAPVTWDAVAPSQYATRTNFDVAGVVDDTEIAVTAHVKVRGTNEFIVDLGTDTGPFHGGASGVLYGLYADGLPTNNLIDGIKLRTVSTKAQDGPQHPGADALEVVKPLADSSDGDVYIYMTDIYRGFPYQWPGSTGPERMADYLEKIELQVNQVLELPEEYQDNIVFVPFNEPEGNMFGNGQWSYNGIHWRNNPTDFFQAWDDAYALIKGMMPDARIGGPNTSTLYDEVKGFLQHTVDVGTVPEVMTWHELSAPSWIRSNVDRYRGWEDEIFAGTEYEGTHLPININEYAYNYHTSVPGQMIQWIAAIEDKKVDADIAYWNIDGNLSDSAVEANRANGQWWLLNAYANMTGHTVTVTPPHPNASYTLQGVATLDGSAAQARLVLGGASGDASVYFDNVPDAVFGPSVHATIREIGWSGQLGDSPQPEVVADLTLPVVGGSVSFEFGDALPELLEESAYEIVLTPGAHSTPTQVGRTAWEATLEAEDAPHTGTGWQVNGPEGSPSAVAKFYTSGRYNVGGLRTGTDVTLDFSVTVPEDGVYDLSVFANSLNTYSFNDEQGPTNVFLRVDGAAEQELFLTLGYKWVVWDHTDTQVELTAGTHTITLAAQSLDGTRSTKGDAIIDKIDLSLANPAHVEDIYEGEYAVLEGATRDYGHAGVSGSGSAAVGAGDSAIFWVYSADDAESTIAVDVAGSGSGTLSVNGVDVATVTESFEVPVFLSGGVNKVVVTGDSGTLRVDRVRVSSSDTLESTTYQAEDAVVAGSATVTDLSLATGGQAVTGIGGDLGNGNTLTFDDVHVLADGTYALTIRYSNEEQSPATHYNPDPLGRHADITVNGQTHRVWFPHTFHENVFWELTVPVELEAGDNTIEFFSEELPNFDGVTYLSDTNPALLRSQFAPNVDSIRVTPFTDIPIVAPVVTADVTSAAAAVSGWFGQDVQVALSLNDGAYGDIEYRVDGVGDWLAYDAPIVVSGHGERTVEYRVSVDGTPDEASAGSVAFQIDATAPVTVATRTPSSGVGTPTAPVALSLSASDIGAGVAGTEYRVDGGDWTAYTGELDFSTVGSFEIDYRSTDEVGNVESPLTTTIVISETPVVGATLSPAAPDGDNGWYLGDVEVTLSLNEGATADIEYRVDGAAAWSSYTAPLVLTVDGQHTVSFRATVEGSPVAGSAGSVDVDIDRVAPVTTVTLDPETGTGSEASPVVATFGASDSVAGVGATEYRVDGGPWQAVSGPVQFGSRGSFEVEYRSVDSAGNTEAPKSFRIAVAAPDNGDAEIALNITTVLQGGEVVVSGTGFLPNEWVDLTLFSSPVFLGSVQANGSGEFSTIVTIPSSTPLGQHTVQAVGATSGILLTLPLAVTNLPAAVAGLAATGVVVWHVAGSALALLIAGALALGYTARRRTVAGVGHRELR